MDLSPHHRESSNDIMRWPTNKEQHAYMKIQQEQNLVACKTVAAERWMADLLKTTGYKWKRQRQWGYRLFDFFNSKLGIAVEVDGPTHDKEYDSVRDRYNYQTSGILVLRVRNFNEDDAARALSEIATAATWNERREMLELKLLSRI